MSPLNPFSFGRSSGEKPAWDSSFHRRKEPETPFTLPSEATTESKTSVERSFDEQRQDDATGAMAGNVAASQNAAAQQASPDQQAGDEAAAVEPKEAAPTPQQPAVTSTKAESPEGKTGTETEKPSPAVSSSRFLFAEKAGIKTKPFKSQDINIKQVMSRPIKGGTPGANPVMTMPAPLPTAASTAKPQLTAAREGMKLPEGLRLNAEAGERMHVERSATQDQSGQNRREHSRDEQGRPFTDAARDVRAVNTAEPAPAEEVRAGSAPEISEALLRRLERLRTSGESRFGLSVRLPDGARLGLRISLQGKEARIRVTSADDSARQFLSDTWETLRRDAATRGIDLAALEFTRN